MAEWSVLVFITADSPFTFNQGVAGFIYRETVADTVHSLPLHIFRVHLYLCSNYQHTPACPEHSHQQTHFCSPPSLPKKAKLGGGKNRESSSCFFSAVLWNLQYRRMPQSCTNLFFKATLTWWLWSRRRVKLSITWEQSSASDLHTINSHTVLIYTST